MEGLQVEAQSWGVCGVAEGRSRRVSWGPDRGEAEGIGRSGSGTWGKRVRGVKRESVEQRGGNVAEECCEMGKLGNGGGCVRGSGPRGRAGGTEPRSSSSLGPGVSLGPLLTQLVLVPDGMKIAPRTPFPKAQPHVALFVLEASILNICLSFRARQNHRHQWTGKRAEVLSHFISGFLRLAKHMLARRMNE